NLFQKCIRKTLNTLKQNHDEKPLIQMWLKNQKLEKLKKKEEEEEGKLKLNDNRIHNNNLNNNNNNRSVMFTYEYNKKNSHNIDFEKKDIKITTVDKDGNIHNYNNLNEFT